jgi:hypothetical protein
VKEFAYQYGDALLAGTRDKVLSTRLTARQRRDPYYADRPSSYNPLRDFGGGKFSFSPSDAATLVELLNDLCYTTEKTGRIDPVRVHTVLRHMLPLLGERNRAAHYRFAGQLRDVLTVLRREPITVGRTGQAQTAVAQTLQNLPERVAYVRVGSKAGVLRTRELPEPVSPQEAATRFQQLREQTCRDLCRRVTDAPGSTATDHGTQAATAAAEPPPQPPNPPEALEQPTRPRSRRSRPVAE